MPLKWDFYFTRHGEGYHQSDYGYFSAAVTVLGGVLNRGLGSYQDNLLTPKGVSQCYHADELKTHLANLTEGDLKDVVFVCSPISRALQTWYLITKEFRKKWSHKKQHIKVLIHPGLRERQNGGASTFASADPETLRARHLYALREVDPTLSETDFSDLVDYRVMNEFLSKHKDYDYGRSSRESKWSSLWLKKTEPLKHFKETVKSFLDYAKVNFQGKQIFAFCHGVTNRVVLSTLNPLDETIKVDGPNRLHSENAQTFHSPIVGRVSGDAISWTPQKKSHTLE